MKLVTYPHELNRCSSAHTPFQKALFSPTWPRQWTGTPTFRRTRRYDGFSSYYGKFGKTSNQVLTQVAADCSCPFEGRPAPTPNNSRAKATSGVSRTSQQATSLLLKNDLPSLTKRAVSPTARSLGSLAVHLLAASEAS